MGRLAKLFPALLAKLAEVRAARAAQAAAEAETRASRAAFLYNPPHKPQRPFEADYPHGAPVDEAGRLLYDMDGRPLGRGVVAGRTTRGGADEAIPPAQYELLGKAAGGARPTSVAPREIGGDAGRIRRVIDPDTGQSQYPIFVSNKLRPEMQDRTVAHELGHLFDELSGEIPTHGLNKELAFLYNDINNPNLAQRREFLRTDDVDISKAVNLRNVAPDKTYGYRGGDIPREQMAEAIRAYMADPNYIKTVAPNTAAAIRAAVNPNPRLRDIIQFNTVAPAAVGLGALGAGSEDAYAGNRLIELAALPDRGQATGWAEPIETPRLHRLADLIDQYRRSAPLMEHISPVSLEGSAELLRNIGRERPAGNRLLEAINLL